MVSERLYLNIYYCFSTIRNSTTTAPFGTLSLLSIVFWCHWTNSSSFGMACTTVGISTLNILSCFCFSLYTAGWSSFSTKILSPTRVTSEINQFHEATGAVIFWVSQNVTCSRDFFCIVSYFVRMRFNTHRCTLQSHWNTTCVTSFIYEAQILFTFKTDRRNMFGQSQGHHD